MKTTKHPSQPAPPEYEVEVITIRAMFRAGAIVFVTSNSSKALCHLASQPNGHTDVIWFPPKFARSE
jgi:hypothetical protein